MDTSINPSFDLSSECAEFLRVLNTPSSSLNNCPYAFVYETISYRMKGGAVLDEAGGSKAILEIRGLKVCYRAGEKMIQAVDGVDLTVSAGEAFGIIGESGSGKSTLVAAILRLLPPGAEICSGNVRFEGHDVLSAGENELRKIRGARMALVSQDPAMSLNPVIEIGTQISEVLRAHLKLKRKERKAHVLELLREVGFPHPEKVYSAYPHELSGGQRQRVVIAQAVACKPSLVIADEPTSKLDSALQSEILELMWRQVKQNRVTLILITHNPAILAGFAGRIAVVYAGKIVEEGPADEVLSTPLHPYTQALMRLFPTDRQQRTGMAKLPVITGEPPDLTQTGPGCRFALRCPDRMPVCANEDPGESMPNPLHHVSCFKYVH